MDHRDSGIEWLALFLLLPLVAILGYLEVQLLISHGEHILVQLSILCLVIILANGWVSANETGLRRTQYARSKGDLANEADLKQSREKKVKKIGLWTRLVKRVALFFH